MEFQEHFMRLFASYSLFYLIFYFIWFFHSD